MRMLLKTSILTVFAGLSTAAPAMTLQSASVGQARGAAIVDPDARLEALAAATDLNGGGGHGKPGRSIRNVLKNDKQLRDAFAWLDNK